MAVQVRNRGLQQNLSQPQRPCEARQVISFLKHNLEINASDLLSRSVHFERTLFCRKCGQSYISKGDMRKHLQSHNLAFECSLCVKVFRDAEKLEEHYAVHSESRDITCPRSGCTKSFRSERSLNVHMTKMHGATPRRRQNLKRSKKFACTEAACTAKFWSTPDRARHIEKKHPLARPNAHQLSQGLKSSRRIIATTVDIVDGNLIQQISGSSAASFSSNSNEKADC